jgi:hypothetical protein
MLEAVSQIDLAVPTRREVFSINCQQLREMSPRLRLKEKEKKKKDEYQNHTL